jgi:hypothetical protein
MLYGNKRSEEFTIEYLRLCCASYPKGCGREEECKRLYDRRCGEWKLKVPRAKEPKYVTEEQRYADSLPVLSTRTWIAVTRDRVKEFLLRRRYA